MGRREAYDELERRVIDQLALMLTEEYRKHLQEVHTTPPFIQQLPPEQEVWAQAEAIYHRHHHNPNEHTDPSAEEIRDWVDQHCGPHVENLQP